MPHQPGWYPAELKDPHRATIQPEAGRGMESRRQCEVEKRGEERK